MKYVAVALVLAALAGLEVAHELWARDDEASLCLAPPSQAESLREALLLHLHSH